VSILDPLQHDTPDNLSYWVRERGMRGMRLFTTTETEGTWLDDPRTFPVWERASSLGIPICIMALFHQLLRHFVSSRYAERPALLGLHSLPGRQRLHHILAFPTTL